MTVFYLAYTAVTKKFKSISDIKLSGELIYKFGYSVSPEKPEALGCWAGVRNRLSLGALTSLSQSPPSLKFSPPRGQVSVAIYHLVGLADFLSEDLRRKEYNSQSSSLLKAVK